MSVGIIFAFGALFCWALGDFFIQKTTRLIGIFKVLFFVGLVGFIILLPLVREEALNFLSQPASWWLLTLAVIVSFFAALVDFRAMEDGKLAVVEPIFGMELPITIALSVAIWHEQLTLLQLLMMLVIFGGISLVITTHHSHWHYHKRIFEKGVAFAGLAAIGMALANFLVGISSQTVSPLFTIWFIHSVVGLVSLVYLTLTIGINRVAGEMAKDLEHYGKLILATSIFDTFAWVFFAQATTLIPISIATAITESYIALTVALGIFINQEKIKPHQIFGIVLAIGGIAVLALIT